MAQDSATNLCKDALIKIRAIDPRETPDSDDLDIVWREFKRMIKSWGISGSLVWATTEDTHTLVSGTTSYTIGSGGDIDTVRPHRLAEGCYVNASGNDNPLTIIGRAEYNRISQKDAGLLTHPNRIWLNPEYPLGKLYLYPAGAGILYLRSYKTLAEPANINADVAYPDEYQDAIVYNLAMRIHPDFKGDPTPFLMAMAKKTRDEIEELNENNAISAVSTELNMIGEGYSDYNIDAG